MQSLFKFLIFFITISSFAQTTISGKIIDAKNKPIANANVFIEGTYDGANSNEAGEFNFETAATANQTLSVSALTY